ncbi:cobalamin-binding protein [Natrarchaeobaculum sulfurireducens]|uniref:ABC-type Fe3+-hydroxamate transport system, periplasmic component n=1 Tax=Natrarchaeobaculum sulfurireducens TaxID=2044521 RepID=A0A346PB38_9EURY|nr:cobalamin-binding protein [Natrarchaeobaculum sulfurireducens]AXR76733.1 ABC-type Fe3+-hydroxamate transport system, periplasmic component [Natrarchaeobaculum sulfurireducens]
MRIVTTLPSATETVAALGLEPVGVSHECDYPPTVSSLPSVTRSRIDASASSAEIDSQVLETADDGVYDVDVETLEALEPELIVTQGMCDVCAVDEAVIADAVEQLSTEPEVLTTDPHSVADVLDDLERIGRAVGREQRAREVRTRLEARIDRVRKRTADIAFEERPRVAIFDWTEPAMIAGHWTAELVEWAGGEYDLATVGERSRPREWTEILEYDPELVIVAPCGFGLDQTAANRTDLTDRAGWDDLTAVREGRVWAMDGHHYLNRPGPRLVETLEALAPIVQPALFDDRAAGPITDADAFDDFDTQLPSLESVAVPFETLSERPTSVDRSTAEP